MRGLTKACVLVSAAVIIGLPVQARADGYVSPWIGADTATRTDNGATAFGAVAGYMGAGVFGFEADVGYTPEFFGPNLVFGDVSTITVIGNAILGVPIGGTHGAGVRPFISGGFGLMRTHVERGLVLNRSRSNNDLVYDVGFGMMGFFNQHIGLRGDVRYFRALHDTDFGSGVNLDPGRRRIWRASAGVAFR